MDKLRGIDKKREFGRIIRFAVVGVVNTGIDIGLFSLLFYVAGAPLLLANAVGYLAGATNSFFMNKFWTFSDTRDQGQAHRQYVVFVTLGLVGLGLSSAVVWSLAFLMPEIVAKILSVGVLIVWNFGISRLIVFRDRDPRIDGSNPQEH